MKSLKILLGILVMLGSVFIYSCDREEFTEEDAQKAQEETITLSDSLQNIRDSLNKVGGVIDYSVNIVDASNATFYENGGNLKSAKGLKNATAVAGAIVTVSQHGITLTDSTGASGLVVFSDLRVGRVNVHIQAPGFTDASFVAKIAPEDDPNVNMYYDVLRTSATMLPVFSTSENMATIEGHVSMETDLTNDSAETAEGVKVLAHIDAADPDFGKYLSALCSDCDEANGEIVQLAYQDAQVAATTGADGTFSMQVPATPQGLPVELEVSEYKAQQSLLLNQLYGKRVTGVQSVRTYFSSSYSATVVPEVPGAYVEFSEPTGSVAEAPDEEAEATAHIGETGIMSVEIDNPGSGYTQAPVLEIDPPANPMGTQAEATANMVNGKVTSVDITEPGSGYTATQNLGITAVSSVEDATADVTVAYSVTGFNVFEDGDGYETRPDVTIDAPYGTGASAQAIMSGYVDNIELTDGGSDYVAPPDVTLTAPEDGTPAEVNDANVTMSAANPIHSILIGEDFNNLYTEAPDVTITSGQGSGATAIAELKDGGQIADITITNPGAGYEQAPTVNIVGGGGFGASADATIDANGSITDINVLENGQGYTSNPTIEISAPAAGGTQASAEAVRAFELEQIVVTNPGNGYNISYNSGASDNYDNEPTVEFEDADGTTLTVNNFTNDDYLDVRPAMNVKEIQPYIQGDGYQTVPDVSIRPKYDEGSGASATASLLYEVEELEILTPGSGYLDPTDVTVTIDAPANMGTRAEASAELGDGVISELEITKAGDGYTAPPIVRVYLNTPSNNFGDISAAVSNGELVSLSIDDAGEGLDYSTNYQVDITDHIMGATFNANLYPNAGIVERVEVDNPGAGYVVAPVVKFNNENTGGTGAEAVATLEGGRISGIEVTNPGSGYVTAPTVDLEIPNYIEKAVGIAQVNDKGRITGVDFDNNNYTDVDFLTQGMGYIQQPEITFHPQMDGMGEGAEAKAVIEDKMIKKVIMINQGKGYHARNYPGEEGFSVKPNNTATLEATSNKTYIKDMYLGTGMRNPNK